MDGPRPPQANELPTVFRFLDSHLRPEQGWSITTEYPLAFTESNRNNIRIITEREQVLAHAVIRPMIIKAPAGLFKVAGLGSVVTSSEHRNQGLSTQTILSCLEAAESQGCDFAILWTNLYDFYRKMGFELAGSELSVLLDRDINVPDQGLKFMESNKVAAEALHRLYSQHTVSSMRTVEEMRKYLQIPNTRIYTAWDDKGALKAYAVEGKGADLNGYIHEWGGGVSGLMALFAHIRKAQQRPLTIIIPRHSSNLLRAIEAQRLSINEGFLGMIKIVNAAALFGKIKKYARSLGVADLVLEKDENKFYIGVRDKICVTESEQDLIRLIFGPMRPSEVQGFGAEAASALDKVLPIHMWIWGWDSI